MLQLRPLALAASGAYRYLRYWTAVLFAAGFLLGACSPALNWRNATLGRMHTVLPCKPDHAQRQVRLQATMLTLEMSGCEAAGGLFAISHVRLPNADQPHAILYAWQEEALRNMHAVDVDTLLRGYRNGESPIASELRKQWQPLRAVGIGPNGKAVEAQLHWWVDGMDIYHAAVYAAKLTPDMVEPLFDQVKIQ